MNIKKAIAVATLMTTLVLGGCGESSTFERTFDIENNSELSVNDVNFSDLTEKLNLYNQFSGTIFIGKEDNLASELIVNQLVENGHEMFESVYFLNSSNRGNNEELLELFTLIGATVNWDEEGNALFPEVELLVIRDGFTLIRLSDFVSLDENHVEEDQIANGIHELFSFIEMINGFEIPNTLDLPDENYNHYFDEDEINEDSE